VRWHEAMHHMHVTCAWARIHAVVGQGPCADVTRDGLSPIKSMPFLRGQWGGIGATGAPSSRSTSTRALLSTHSATLTPRGRTIPTGKPHTHTHTHTLTHTHTHTHRHKQTTGEAWAHPPLQARARARTRTHTSGHPPGGRLVPGINNKSRLRPQTVPHHTHTPADTHPWSPRALHRRRAQSASRSQTQTALRCARGRAPGTQTSQT
jgi:hypothetical protein